MTHISALKDAFLATLAERLLLEDYSPSIRNQEYTRRLPSGKATIHVSFIPHPPTDVDLTIDLGIRIDAVERLANADSKHLSERKQPQTYTIGAELGNLTIGRPKRWSLITLDDVSRVIDPIFDDIRTIALSFIEKYSTAESVYELLLEDSETTRVSSPFVSKRYIRTLGLAYLLGFHDDIDKIMARC